MNPINLPNRYKESTVNKLINIIKYSKEEYLLNIPSIVEIVDYLSTHDNTPHKTILKSVLFVISQISRNGYESPYDYNLFGGIPRGGFEFINKGKTGKENGLGIYHAHISEIDKGFLYRT